MRVADEEDRRVLYVGDAGHVVRELVRAEADLDGLEVLPVSLEEAFIALTGGRA
jgi:ABC-2 type transport system ATP-binding protein